MNSRQSALESAIEEYLVAQVEAAGGIAEKTISPGKRGYYDRVMVLPLPDGTARIIFVEVKKPRGSRTAIHQSKRHKAYEALGAEVAVVKTKADVDRLLNRGVQQPGAALKT